MGLCLARLPIPFLLLGVDDPGGVSGGLCHGIFSSKKVQPFSFKFLAPGTIVKLVLMITQKSSPLLLLSTLNALELSNIISTVHRL